MADLISYENGHRIIDDDAHLAHHVRDDMPRMKVYAVGVPAFDAPAEGCRGHAPGFAHSAPRRLQAARRGMRPLPAEKSCGR